MPQPSVRPSRFIDPTSGVRFDQPNFSEPSSKHSSKCREENGRPSDSSIFGSFSNAEFDRIDLELIGQLIHRRFRRVQAGNCAGAAHVGSAADVSFGASKRHAQIGHTVLERRRLAAILVMSIKYGPRVNIIVLHRNELAVARCAQANALLCARAVPDSLEHHLAANDELHWFAKLPCGGRGKRTQCVHGNSLLPKPEPTNFVITRTFSFGRPNICASTLRKLTTPCDDSYSVKVVPSQIAVVACSSSGLWVSAGVT